MRSALANARSRVLARGTFAYLVYWLVLVVVLLADLEYAHTTNADIDDGTYFRRYTASMIVLFVAAALVPLRPRLFGWIFLMLDAAVAATSLSQMGIFGYVAVVVIFVWGWSGYATDAACGSLILVAAVLYRDAYSLLGDVMLIVLLGTGFFAGHQMRRYLDERDEAQTQLWQRERQQMAEAQQFRDGLAMQLHDSLAGTLSVAATLSEALRRDLPGDSDLAEKAELLGLQVRSSLRELREIIQLLDDPRSPSGQDPDLASELERGRRAAAGAGVTLHLQYEPGDLDHLPVTTASALSAFIREVTTNLVKFAAPASEASLTISRGGNTVEVMAKNEYRDEVRDAVLSSGRGLRTLEDRLVSAGGSMDVWSVNNQWHVYGEVPVPPGEISAQE